MGLLDDAIREHLELRRQHGADAADVARQEREALGSGRMPPPATPADAGSDPEPAPDAAHDPPPVAPEAEPPFPDAIPEPPVREVDPPEPEPAASAPPPAPPAPPPPAPPAPEPPPPAAADDDEDDLDWSDPAPLEASADPKADAGEDVLEETPEFLQETPEHDRLWFEQRPPKDFDF